MARLPRVTQNIFGSNPGFEQFTQFGSTYNNSTVYTTNIATIQSLANWEVGWYEAAINQSSPLIEDMNSAFLVFTTQLQYIFETGIPEYDTGTTYYTGNIANTPVIVFLVTSANATAGATYTNNTQTFTVMTTISADNKLVCTYTGQPTSSGTLTKASGTGDTTITFSSESVSSASWISIADSNLNNAVTNTSFWMPYIPSLGKPFQRLSVNSTSTGTEYTYHTINDQIPTGVYTVPAGYNLMVGFLTIKSGLTWTVAGSMCAIGPLIVSGDLVISGGNVRIV